LSARANELIHQGALDGNKKPQMNADERGCALTHAIESQETHLRESASICGPARRILGDLGALAV
jgi:hypothetical protein